MAVKVVAGSEFIVNGKIVTFAKDGEISFAGDDTEVGQIGFLKVTGNWERNRGNYRGRRDESGRLLPIEDQVNNGEGETVEQFLARISREDAAYFGAENEWVKVHTKAQQAHAPVNAAVTDNLTDKAKTEEKTPKTPPPPKTKTPNEPKNGATGKGKTANKTENKTVENPPKDPDLTPKSLEQIQAEEKEAANNQ